MKFTRRGRRVRVMSAILAAFAVMSIAEISTAGTASAVSCYGDYCSGQDPQASGCANDAYTVASRPFANTGGVLELRWSPTCKTNWARLSTTWVNPTPNALYVVQGGTGYTQRGARYSGSGFSWTAMIYSPVRCVTAVWLGAPYGDGSSGGSSTACV